MQLKLIFVLLACIILTAHSTTTIDLKNTYPTSSMAQLLGGKAKELLGGIVNASGDVNGDGLDDLIIASPAQETTATSMVYVIYGRVGAIYDDIDFTALTPSQGYFATDYTGGQFGVTTDYIGDVNADGIGDFIVGDSRYTYGTRNNVGTAYVIFGKAGTNRNTVDVRQFQTSNTDGIQIIGPVTSTQALGEIVGSAGDFT